MLRILFLNDHSATQELHLLFILFFFFLYKISYQTSFISIFKKFNQVFSTKLSLRTYIRIKLKNNENYEKNNTPLRIRYDVGNYIQRSRDQLLAWADFISNSKYLNALFNSLILFIIHISVLRCMLIAKDLFSLYYFAFSPFIIFFPARFVQANSRNRLIRLQNHFHI